MSIGVLELLGQIQSDPDPKENPISLARRILLEEQQCQPLLEEQSSKFLQLLQLLTSQKGHQDNTNCKRPQHGGTHTLQRRAPARAV